MKTGLMLLGAAVVGLSLTGCVNFGHVSAHDISRGETFGIHGGDDLATATAILKAKGFNDPSHHSCEAATTDTNCAPGVDSYEFVRHTYEWVTIYADQGKVKAVRWQRMGLIDQLNML